MHKCLLQCFCTHLMKLAVKGPSLATYYCEQELYAIILICFLLDILRLFCLRTALAFKLEMFQNYSQCAITSLCASEA